MLNELSLWIEVSSHSSGCSNSILACCFDFYGYINIAVYLRILHTLISSHFMLSYLNHDIWVTEHLVSLA